jgi:hypothetical protein
MTTTEPDLPEVLDDACHSLGEFLLGLAHDEHMPAELKANLARLGCQQLVAALDGDVEAHDRITAEGQALCREYDKRRKLKDNLVGGKA